MAQPSKKTLPKNSEKNTGSNTAEKIKPDIETDKVRFLVELMKDNNLTELEIQQGTTKIRLKRGNEASESATVFTQPSFSPHILSPATFPQPAAAMPTAAETTPAAAALQPPVQEKKNTRIIKSPMVGTFYSAPNPDVPPFVKAGDNISADTTVCIIEAMKVYNEIQAECAGKITAILIKNGSAVEFGTPLFEIVADIAAD